MADSRYVLMHKNTPVADLQLDTDTGVIRSVGHVYNALHVPVGIPVKKGVIDRSALNTWWTGRAIPASRDRIRDALRELELASTQLLLDKCLGLSLSDQYWICPTSSGVRWEEVNFFQMRTSRCRAAMQLPSTCWPTAPALRRFSPCRT